MSPILATLAACAAYLLVVSITVASPTASVWPRLLVWLGALSFGFFVLEDSVKSGVSSLGIRAVLQFVVPLGLVLPTLLTRPMSIRYFNSRPLAYIAALFAWIVITLPAARDHFFSFGNTVQALVGLFLALRIVSLYRSTGILLRDLVLAVAALAAASWIAQLADLSNLGIITLATGGGVGRLSGTLPYVHPNELAFISALGATTTLGIRLCAPAIWREKHLPDRLVFALLSLLSVTCLAAWTRTTFTIMLLTCLLVYMLTPGRRLGRLAVVGLVIAMVYLVATLQADLITNYLYRGQSQETLLSFNSRFTSWEIALSEIGFSRMGYGVGLGGHRVASSYLSEIGNLDSSWISLLVNAGYVSFLFFLGFWVSLIASCIRQARGTGLAPLMAAVVVPSLLVTLYNPSIEDLNYIGVFLLSSTLGVARASLISDFWKLEFGFPVHEVQGSYAGPVGQQVMRPR